MLSITEKMLKERQKSILKSTVEFYIKTAKPVASKDLLDEFEREPHAQACSTSTAWVNLSPATIRNEMLKLDEFGYLEQPHTSAGRVPTDSGYRFFVDDLDNLYLEKNEAKTIEDVFREYREDDFIKNLGATISSISKTFSMVGIFDKDILYETGFSEIMDEPEFNDSQEVKNFGKLADLANRDIYSLINSYAREDEHLFIGGENPWKEAFSYSILMAPWHHGNLSGFFTIIGPKRTNYSKHKAISKHIKNISHGKTRQG